MSKRPTIQQAFSKTTAQCSNTAIAHRNHNNHALENRNKFGLNRNEVCPEFRIPFIMTGYRRPNISAKECMQSAFHKCNETVNIWSHFIPFLMFCAKFYELFSTRYSVFDPSTWPLLTSALGICGFCLASSFAHTFYCMSIKAKDCCFFIDYAAISVYTVGVGHAFYFYGRPLRPEILIYKTEWPFIISSVIISISATLLCCLTTHYWHNYKYFVRTFSMCAPFFMNSWPIFHRMIGCSNSVDCVPSSTTWLYQMHCFLYFLSAIVNVLRFPESVLPGIFDFVGHSHNLLHVGVAVGALYQFDTIHFEMIRRKTSLMRAPVQCSLFNTLLPFSLSIVVNFGIAFAFSRRIQHKNYQPSKK